jgi:F-box/leucine-rich repeat protein 14
LTELETLSLYGRGIGDEGLAHLAPLTRMKYLTLGGGIELTDEGLRYLSRMRRLDSLHILESRISERGLAFLYPLKTIHILRIDTTVPIGPQALARLRMELPHLQSLRIDRPESARLNTLRRTVSSNQTRRDRW